MNEAESLGTVVLYLRGDGYRSDGRVGELLAPPRKVRAPKGWPPGNPWARGDT